MSSATDINPEETLDAVSVSPTDAEQATDTTAPEAAGPQPDDLSAALSHLADLEGLDLPTGDDDDEPTPEADATDESDADQAEEDVEAEADAADDDDNEQEDDDEDEDDPDKDLPEAVQKRIDTLVAIRDKYRTQRDEARRELEDKEERLAQLEAGAVSLTPTEQNPLSDLTDPKTVQERMKQAEAVIAWAEQNPDGAEVKDPKTGDYVEFSADEVRNRRLQAERIKEIHGPKRLEYLDRHKEAVAFAKEAYPDLFQAGTWQANNADQFLNANPGILENPLWPVIAGDWLTGAAVRAGMFKLIPVKADQSKKTGATAARKADDSTPSPAPTNRAEATPSPEPPAQPSSATPPRRPAGQVARQSAKQRILDSGGEDEDALLEVAASLVG